MKSNYIPNRQDIIWINFLPSVGEEIRGRHPAVVLSTEIYSKLTGLVLVTPITHGTNNRLKDFFIEIKSSGKIEGFVNPLQVFSFSFRKRKVQYTGEYLDNSTYAEVHKRIRQLLD